MLWWGLGGWLDFSVIIWSWGWWCCVLWFHFFGDWLGDVGWWSWYWIEIVVIVIVIVYWVLMGWWCLLWFEWGLMFDCIIVVILRSIRVDDLFHSLWVGGIWGWSGVLGSCDHGLLFHVWLWFLGVHLFDTCFVVKRVLWFWTIREIWVIYIVVLIKVMRWLLLSGCDSWFLSWCCKLWFLGWVWWCFGVICLWSWLVRCRGWGFVLVSILSAFVAYVVVDWCSGVDWLVVGGDLCFSGVEWWLCELVLCLGSVGWLSGLLLG